METGLGSPFKMVEAKLFLQLLMGLFANPARLDGGGDILDRRVCVQVREIIYLRSPLERSVIGLR